MTTIEQSAGRQQMVDYLKEEHEKGYAVNREIAAAHLGSITLLAILGPTAAGKSTLVNRVIEKNLSVNLYLSSTTRPRAPRDGTDYRTDVPIEEFYEAVQERSLVNYFVHPSDNLYGTFLSGFRPPVTIGAIGASSLPQLEEAPFQDMHSLYTVMDGATYAYRLGLDQIEGSEGRIHQNDIAARLQESLASISFARTHLNHPGFGALRLTNDPGGLDDAAETVVDIAYSRGASHLRPKLVHGLLDEMNDVIHLALEKVCD